MINLRARPVGGPLRERPVFATGRRPGRKVLLIHGFNTTQAEAEAGYEAFQDLIERQAPRLARRICPVYWPGDSGLKGGAYPWLVERAAQAGAQLAEWMARQEDELVIVAHSLGCRLTLEALVQLPLDRGPRIRLFLMAAAVPVGLFEDGSPMREAARRADSVDVLHSRADGVLAFWFRLGQTAAPGEAALLPEAVGLRGRPRRKLWSRTVEMPGYDHGQYWGGHRMATHLAHRLGAAVAKPRPIRLNALPRLVRRRPAVPPRALGLRREIVPRP
ncbi:MAG: alpha/beta hydrolase [Pseudomonadota bacterium]